MQIKLGTKLGISALFVAFSTMAAWGYHIRQVEIPENRAVFVAFFLLAVGLGLAAFIRQRSWVGCLAAVPAILLGLLVPYTMSISEQTTTQQAIQVGDTIPDFESVDWQGAPFSSDSLHGHILLIKFFRAHW